MTKIFFLFALKTFRKKIIQLNIWKRFTFAECRDNDDCEDNADGKTKCVENTCSGELRHCVGYDHNIVFICIENIQKRIIQLNIWKRFTFAECAEDDDCEDNTDGITICVNNICSGKYVLWLFVLK